MKPVAVGVSGRIGSGKTTLAQALAERLGCPHASFGEYVRGVASDRGLDAEDRRILQDLGDELIAAGWDAFCDAVLQSSGYAGGSVVVDGIRQHLGCREVQRRAEVYRGRYSVPLTPSALAKHWPSLGANGRPAMGSPSFRRLMALADDLETQEAR